MKISDAVVSLLNQYAARPLAATISPVDGWIYAKGAEDGATILAQQILETLVPDEPVQDSE